MMDLVKKVRAILEKEFGPRSKIKLYDQDGIVGTIVSPRFERMETLERIGLIGNLLEQHPSPEEYRRVLMIVPAKPTEEIAFSS